MHGILSIAAFLRNRLRIHAVSLYPSLSRPRLNSLTHWQLAYATLLLVLSVFPFASSWAGTSVLGPADGSFETGLHGLTIAGDIRLVTSFGSLWPTQGTQAVVLTTAPNAGAEQAHTDISVIRIDSLTIPLDTPQLRLDYTFLTNELTPSFTNDAFTVTLALMAGGEETLLRVDTFDPQHPAAWTGYARQTGFRTLVADLSAYAGTGETVSLELRLTDVGDGRGDSAVLLDNMQFTDPGEPLACANIVQQALQLGDTLFADGSCSTDSDDLIIEYRWDFGDGNELIGRFVEHTYAADGIYQATLTVKDQAGNTSTTTFHVVVGAINHAPQIVSAPIVLAANHTLYRYDVLVNDPEVAFGDVLTFALSEAPAAMSIDAATGSISWTPTAGDARQNPVTLTVTDSLGLSSSQSFTLTVDAEVYIAASDSLGRLYTARRTRDGSFDDYRFIEDIGRNTVGVALADFDHDGDFDMLTGSAQGHTLTLFYLEKQGAQFAPPVPIATLGDSTTPAGDILMDMAAADFNNDGNMDVALNSNGPHSWLLMNAGQLTFASTTFFAADFEADTGSWGNATCNSDLQRDNSSAGSGAWSMQVFATAANACLAVKVSPSGWQLTQGPMLSLNYRIPPDTPVGLRVFVSGFGWLFLGGSPAAAPGTTPAVSAVNLIDDDQWHSTMIDLSRSVHQKTPESTTITSLGWWSNANAAAGAHFWFDAVQVTRRTYVSGFDISLLPGTTGNGRGLDAADVNGDGHIDIARGRCCDGLVELHLGDGTGQFSISTPVDAGSDPYGIVLADVDTDGLVDLLTQSAIADALFFQGNGDGTFQAGATVASIDTNNFTAFATFDVNQDSAPDLLAVDFTFRQVWFYPGSGAATFGPRTLIGTTSGSTLGIATPAGRVIGQPVSHLLADAETINAGGSIAFDASASYDDGSIIDYHWDFGDGSTASGTTVSHLYSSEGSYRVVLTITDDDGHIDRRSRPIVVIGVPPIANAGGPYVVSEAEAINGSWPIALDGSASSDAETGISSYTWDVDASDGIGTDATGPTPRHIYSAPGVYTVTLTVTDDVGQSDTATTSVTVTAGTAPSAAINGPAVLDESAASLGSWAMRADLSGSADDLAIASYTVDWGDNTQTTISALRDSFEDGNLDTNPTWTSNGGVWTVIDGELQQTDTSSGWKWLQDLSVTYQDFILQLDVYGVSSGGQIGIVFRHTNLSGSLDTFLLSSADANDNWRFTDWSTNTVLAEGGSGWEPGIWYHLRLVVTGNTMQLFVTPEGGVETLQLEATNPSHPSGGIGLLANAQSVIYDNVQVTPTGDSLQPMHLYSAAGDYTISLTVTDHAAQSASANLSTSVTANAAPVADAGGPYVLTEADATGGAWAFSLDASASSDDHGIQRYQIDFGDGTSYSTGFNNGAQGSYFATGTDLYGYSVTSTSLSRIIATEDSTTVEVIDLSDKRVIASTSLNRFATWEVTPGDHVAFKIKASKPVVALATDTGKHSAFVPSLDTSPVGHEFLFQPQGGQSFFIYAIEEALVQVFDSSNLLVAEQAMRPATVWRPSSLSDTAYHVVASGKVAMQTTGDSGYTTVPATSGDAVGQQFYFATTAGTSGAFAVFAYAAATLEVFDLQSGSSLYTHSLALGEFWMQAGVGTRRLRLESTGDVEVWAGDTEGGTAIVNLGDDISMTSGRGGTEFYLHTLQDGFVILAPNDATQVSINSGDLSNTLKRDEAWHLTPADLPGGAGVYHITATQPIIIQSLGRANGFNDSGTYLGGVAARHAYSAPGPYTVTLTAIDQAGQRHTATTTVAVQAGDPPVAQISAPAVVDETFVSGGQWTVGFDASASSDDHGIFNYLWDFGDGNSSSSVNPTHVYIEAGTYSVTLTVTDHARQQSSTTFTIVVTATAPPLADAGGPYVFGEDVATAGVWTATLDGSPSSDDVGIFDYQWVFGLETIDFAGATLNTARWLSSDGVSQDDAIHISGIGSWGSRYIFSRDNFERKFTFQARILPANLSGSQFAMWGLKNTDTSNFSFTTMPHAIYFANSIIYIYEDGNFRGPKGSYTPGVPYDIRIRLQETGALYEFKASTESNWTLLFDSGHTSQSPFKIGGVVHSGDFVFDDAAYSEEKTGPLVSKTYWTPGLYSATLHVRDHALQAATDSTSITVEVGAPPIADPGRPYLFDGGRTIQFNASASSDDVGIATYHWDFGDGTQSQAVSPSHFYANIQPYTVSLTVTDQVLQSSTSSASVSIGRVNLSDTTGVSGDWQALTIGGAVSADIINPQAVDLGPFTLTWFDDLNGNGLFDAGLDTILGQSAQDGLAAGARVQLTTPLSGPVSFRNNLLYAFVDYGDPGSAAEPRNYANSAQLCTVAPPGGLFDPVLEWAWTNPSVLPDAVNVISTPAVIDLDGDGMPEVVLQSTASTSGANINPGYLRVLDGASGSERFTVTSHLVNVTSQLAVGDIDLDGRPEIITVHSDGNHLIAFEHDGLFKWESPVLETFALGGPVLADLDADGWPEIIIGRQVLNHDGSLRWIGTGGRADQAHIGPLSLVADLDLDGVPEVVAGNTVYNADGAIVWQVALPDGFNAVANFDDDPFPEVVLVAQGHVWLLEHDGSLKWGPSAIPGAGRGGPPTVADYDSDGEVEIGVAGRTRYAVFETDGSLKWQAVIRDGSSHVTGSSVFDFDGDGAVEVIYRDEVMLRVYRGSDGAVLFATPQSSGTGYEYPLVADVDGDGKAELISVANTNLGFGPQQGVFVYGSASDSWVATRPIWNQHTYHITNVNDDGTIPLHELNNWQLYNAYRSNFRTSGLSSFDAVDLTASFVRIVRDASVWHLTARIGNGGALPASAGVSVAFYDGDPQSGGLLLGAVATSTALAPNAFEDVTLTVSEETLNTVWVVADDDGTLSGAINECQEANNRHDSGLLVRLNQPPVAAAGGPYTVQEGVALSLDGTGSSDPDGNLLTYAWDLDNDGMFDDATGATPVVIFLNNGTFTIDLQVSDGIETSTDTAIVTVTNAIPVVTLGDPLSLDEGDTLAQTGSFTDSGADAWSASVDYGDGSGTQPLPLNADQNFHLSHVYPDNGLYTVTVTVTDDDGGVGNAMRTITVINVAPVVIAGPNQSTLEGGSISLAPSTYIDVGTTDTHSATINWGDGSVEDGTLSAAGSSGSISGTHLYDDDGFFSVTICVTDKDTASGCDTLDVIVKNISPTTTLDTTDSVALTADGPSFFISQANASQTRSATGTDIGSDDLTFTWTWGDGVVLQNTHYNNGSTADGRPPANRGAVAPFSATDTVSHTYAAAGSYILSVQLSDDDGDSGQPPTSATIPTLITDKQDCVMTIGFWQHQFNPETRKPQVDHLSLQSYLSLINTASDVFSEVLAASTRTDAWLLLQPEDTSETTIQGQAMEQVLATWLNFAWGAVGWDDSIPDLGRPWHQVMADIEATFLNPHASHTDYVRANDLAVSINEMDAKRKACKKG